MNGTQSGNQAQGPVGGATDHGREALLVLGMHRSGTSALAGMLAKLGAQPPRTLIPAGPSNPEGYWESQELMRFHDRLLSSSGSHWRDWEAFNPGWIDSGAAVQFAERLPGLLEQEFGDAPLMLVKDPRICRFVPFWLSALERSAIRPRIVIPVREPAEVAASLGRRNRMARGEALLAWLRHVLDAERATRGADRAFVFYEDLLEDWRAVARTLSERLGVKWPRWSSAVELEIDAFLRTELAHHRARSLPALGGTGLDGWVEATRAALRTLAAGDGDPAAQADLDRVREELDRLGEVFGVRLREQEQQLAEQAREAKANAESAQAARREVDALAEALAKAEAQLGAAMDRDRQLQAVRAQLAERNDILEATARSLEAQVDATGKQRGDVAARLEVCEQKLALARAELARLRCAQEAQVEAFARAGLRERDELAARLAERLSSDYWQQLDAAARSVPRWRRLARRLLRRPMPRTDADDIRRLEQSDLFDGGFYLREYPDVAASGISPAVHYLHHGHAEGRNPGPGFDAAWYLKRHPDVAAAGINPLLHYEQAGRGEGRAIRKVATAVAATGTT